MRCFLAGALCLTLLAAATNPGPPSTEVYDIVRVGSSSELYGRVWVELNSAPGTGCTEHWLIRYDAKKATTAGGYTGRLTPPNQYEFKASKASKPADVEAFKTAFFAVEEINEDAVYYEHDVTAWTPDACTVMNANPSACIVPTPKAAVANSCPSAVAVNDSDNVMGPRKPTKASQGGAPTFLQVDTGTTQVSFGGDLQGFVYRVGPPGYPHDEYWMFANADGLMVGEPVCFQDFYADPPNLQIFTDCTCKWLDPGTNGLFVKIESEVPTVEEQ